jgi:hypothetical protein
MTKYSHAMKKLILSCLFAVTVGLITGCGNSSSSSDSGNAQQPPAQSPSAPPPGPPPSATHTNQ